MGRDERELDGGTPYDDVFRTLLNDCSGLVLPILNEVFGEKYTGEERIVFSPNEHFLNQQGGKETKRITDASFAVYGDEEKRYLFECQSTADNSMLVRIFEYSTQIALDEGKIEGNILSVRIPRSAILFLRSTSSTPDTMKIRMETPGGTVCFDVMVMKIKQYSIEAIFGKNLLFLIPFHIFLYESRLEEYNEDKEKLAMLKREYMSIINQLDKLLQDGVVSVYTRTTLVEMSNKVLENIAGKYVNVREGVKAVMGGKILEYEAKTIRNEGLREGLREGINEGILKTLFDLVKKNLLSVKDAANQAELTEDDFVAKMQAYKQ